MVPEGLICGTDKQDLIRWRRKFPSPIVDVWRLRRGRLERVDLFAKQHIPLRRPSAASLLDDEETDEGEEGGDEESPFLYIGSHQSQLYIQESVRLRTEADSVTADRVGLAVVAYPRVTWRPYLVRSAARPSSFSFTNFQCCGSGMFFPDPDFYPSLIPYPVSKNSTKERSEKKFVVIPFFVQIVTKLSKIWVWNPGSGKNLSRIPDQGSKRHRIPDPDSQH